MKKTEAFFLMLATMFVLWLYLFYLTELCYDRDLPSYVCNTLDIINGRGWYYTTWQNKPPGIMFIILAAFNLLGQSFKSIYTIALFFNLSSVFLIYSLGKQILSKETRLYFILPAFFVLFLTSNVFMVHSANTEVFLITFEIAGILFLGLNRYFIAGLFLGSGFLIRQTGIFTFIAGILFIIALKFIDKISLKRLFKDLLKFIIAFILPFIFISLYFLQLGVFNKFLYYSFINPLEHIGGYLGDIRQKDLILTNKLFWIKFNFEMIIFGMLSLVGLIYTLIRRTKARILISLWFIVICLWLLRGAIYTHHYIQLIAPLACLSLLGAADVFEGINNIFKAKPYLKNISLVILVVILLIPYARLINFFVFKKISFYSNYGIEDRFNAARYIKEHTTLNDKIFVWDHLNAGAIYLWSGRNSITRFAEKNAFLPARLQDHWALYTQNYRLNQEQFLLDYLKHPPKYIVVVIDYNKVVWWRNLIRTSTVSIIELGAADEISFAAEKEVFPGFFNLLEEDYQLEKEISICKIYRFIKS